MFFDDDKKVEQTPKPQPQGVLAVIAHAVGQILVILVKSCVVAILWLGGKIFGQYFETLKHLLDFRGLEREVAARRIAIALCIIAVLPGYPLFYIYKETAVRDYMTLSQTRVVNIAMSRGRIFFPDRTYFVPKEERGLLDFRSSGAPGLYLTYYIDTKEKISATVIKSGDCQLVPRALSIKIFSNNFPAGAEGFDDKVTYYVTYEVAELTGIEYLLGLFYNQRFFSKSKTGPVTFTRTESWEKFKEDWDHIETYSSGDKGFTVKARDNHHAIICS